MSRPHIKNPAMIDDDCGRPTKRSKLTSPEDSAADLLLFLSSHPSMNEYISPPRRRLTSKKISNSAKKYMMALNAPPRLEQQPIVSEDERDDDAYKPGPLNYKVVQVKIYGKLNSKTACEQEEGSATTKRDGVPPVVALALAPPPRLPRVEAGSVVASSMLFV